MHGSVWALGLFTLPGKATRLRWDREPGAAGAAGAQRDAAARGAIRTGASRAAGFSLQTLPSEKAALQNAPGDAQRSQKSRATGFLLAPRPV